MLGEFVYEFHGRHMRGMYQTRVEFLFARFAWTILHLVKGLILLGRPKTALARYRVWEDGGEPELKGQSLLAKDVDLLFGGGGSRSASPRKRSRTSSEQGRGSGCACVWGEVDHWNSDASPRKRRCTSFEHDTDSECVWSVVDHWNTSSYELSVFEEEEENRSRKKTRDEDNVRYKKRPLHGSESDCVSGSVPSLAASGTSCGKSVPTASVSPSPQMRYIGAKNEENQEPDWQLAQASHGSFA